MTLRLPTATLSADNPRAKFWLDALGTLDVPIRSPVACMANVGDLGPQEVYMLDVARLDGAQVDKLVIAVAHKFGDDPTDVRAALTAPEGGMPVLAEGCSVTFDARMLV